MPAPVNGRENPGVEEPGVGCGGGGGRSRRHRRNKRGGGENKATTEEQHVGSRASWSMHNDRSRLSNAERVKHRVHRIGIAQSNTELGII